MDAGRPNIVVFAHDAPIRMNSPAGDATHTIVQDIRWPKSAGDMDSISRYKEVARAQPVHHVLRKDAAAMASSNYTERWQKKVPQKYDDSASQRRIFKIMAYLIKCNDTEGDRRQTTCFVYSHVGERIFLKIFITYSSSAEQVGPTTIITMVMMMIAGCFPGPRRGDSNSTAAILSKPNAHGGTLIRKEGAK